MNTDPIADFLTRIRNASRAGDTNVSIPFSRLKEEMGKILEQEGFIEKSRIDRTGKFPIIHITLKPENEKIQLTRISKPGKRVYQKHSDIRPVKNGFGISIMSTSAGVVTGATAKEKALGGELLCEVY
jgi:small subunit ribosomal protein S8